MSYTTFEKMSKQETRVEMTAQLRKLARIADTPAETPADKDIKKIALEIITRNITLLISAAFYGDTPTKTTRFDETTDLWEALAPFRNKGIGEARKKQLSAVLQDYFTPAAVDGYTISAYYSDYYDDFVFNILRNGYITKSAFCRVHLRFDRYTNTTADPAKPITPEAGTCYRFEGTYIPAADVKKTAAAYYKRDIKRIEKAKKLLAEIDALYNEACADLNGVNSAIKGTGGRADIIDYHRYYSI